MNENSNLRDNDKEEFVIILQENKQNMIVKPVGEKTQQFLCALIASIGAFIMGTVVGWTSPSLEYLEFTNYSAPFQTKSQEEGGWIATCTPLGAIIGALPAISLADAFGRKTIMIIFSIPWICTWIMTIFASNVLILCAARFISGIIIGLVCAVLPIYLNEIAEDSIRGALGTMFQLFITLGVLFVYFLAIFESYTILCYSTTTITIAFSIFMLFIPETPLYYMNKNRRNEAEKSLRRLRGPHYDVQAELNVCRKNLENSPPDNFSIDLLLKKANAKALIISIGLMIFQQLSGINAVIFFAGQIFQDAGATSPEICTIIIGVIAAIATTVSSFLVDRAGRKILLIISSVGVTISNAALGYYFWLTIHNMDKASSMSWLPLVSVIFIIITFSLGLGPLPWMLVGEVLAPEIKSYGTAASVAINWIFVSIVTLFFQPLSKIIGTAATFWLFATFGGLSAVFVIVILPETKGKSIYQVQDELAGKKRAKIKNNKV